MGRAVEDIIRLEQFVAALGCGLLGPPQQGCHLFGRERPEVANHREILFENFHTVDPRDYDRRRYAHRIVKAFCGRDRVTVENDPAANWFHSQHANLLFEQQREYVPAEAAEMGVHPDDAEIRGGGSAILWASLGHHVELVSATNGDVGHSQICGKPLAARRYAEVQAAAKILGTTTRLLDIHDGELMPTLENRRSFTRLTRRWQADRRQSRERRAAPTAVRPFEVRHRRDPAGGAM